MTFRTRDIPLAMRIRLGLDRPPQKLPRRSEKVSTLGTFRNGLERDYAAYLHLRMLAGEIDLYLYEPWSFPLGARRKYTPDFLVWLPDGRREVHETKGYMWQRDAVRLDWFVASYPTLPLIVVRKERGQWMFERRSAV